MYTRNTHTAQISRYIYQNSFSLTLHYIRKQKWKHLKVTMYVKPQDHEENEHTETKPILIQKKTR